MNNIHEINEIFIKIFNDNSIVLQRSTSPSDIENWNSLRNMQLVVALEKHFCIRIDLKDIQAWKNIGDICDGINEKIKLSS